MPWSKQTYIEGVTKAIKAIFDNIELGIEEALAKANAAIPATQKGAASGVATLDGGVKVPIAQIPAVAINEVFTVTSEAEQLALPAHKGDVAIRTDINKQYILTVEPATAFGNWTVFTSGEGKEGPKGEVTWRGAWKAATAYTKGDAVSLGGSSYVCIKTMTAGEDVEPPNATFWNVLAQVGATGATGGGGTLGGWINPMEAPYNAKGDGATNDTTAVASAITALPAAGGVLFLPAGKNFLVDTLAGKSNLTVIGYGATLQQKAKSEKSILETSTLISNFKCYGVRFLGGATPEGPNTKNFNGAILFKSCDELTIRDCYAASFAAAAFQAYGCQKVLIDGNTITKCPLAEPAHNAIDINGAARLNSDIVITNNYIDECPTATIAYVAIGGTTQGTNGLRLVITNNICRATVNGVGIMIEGEINTTPASQAREVIISSNMVSTNSASNLGYGIRCWVDPIPPDSPEEMADLVISGNQISSGAASISTLAARAVVTGNNCRCFKGDVCEFRGGTSGAAPEHAVITGNLFWGGAEIPFANVVIWNLNHVTFANNRIFCVTPNAKQITALECKKAGWLSIAGNMIANGNAWAIHMVECNDWDITGNRILNPCEKAVTGKEAAIYLEGTTNTGGNFSGVMNNIIVDDRGLSASMVYGVMTTGTEVEYRSNNVIRGAIAARYKGTFKTVAMVPATEHAFSINGKLAVEAVPGYTVRLEGQEERNIEAVDLRLEEGTECELTIRRNGSVLNATYEKIKLKKGTPQRLTKTVALADKDYIDLSILAITGAPGSLSVTLYERQVT